MAQKPPDLDNSGSVVRPPDLDSNGNPLQMTFAIVNGVRVPLGSDEADFGVGGPTESDTEPLIKLSNPEDQALISQPPQVKNQSEEPPFNIPEPSAILDRLTRPLVDFTPQMRSAMEEYQQEHPILGGALNFGADMLTGQSSPLSLGLGVLGAGESVASKLGADQLAKVLKIPSRVAGGGMIWHGLGQVGDSETTGGKIGGGIEAVLGGLALKGPKVNLGRSPIASKVASEGDVFDTSTRQLERPMSVPDPRVGLPEFNTAQFGLDLADDNLPYPLNVVPNRVRPPSTNAIVFDALLPEKLKLNERGAATPKNIRMGETLGESVTPQLAREISITPDAKKWYEGIAGKFIKETLGEVKLPDLKNRKRPLKALDELHDALIDASSSREMTEELYKDERSKRFAAYDQPKPQGRKGLYVGLSRLKGELPKDAFSPIEMNPDSARALYNEINRRTDLSTPDRIHASTGLGKILGDYKSGEAPARYEIDAIRKVFGDAVADQLMELHSDIPITVQALSEAANLSKSMMSSMDASAPFRQGLGLVHTREFWNNYRKMYTYIGKESYNITMDSILNDPLYNSLKKAGLHITKIGELGNMEEQFSSKLAGKIPGIPASERMYTGFLNKTRFDVTKRLMQEAEKAGLKPFIKNSAGELVPTKLGKEITQYVNNATGRGSLGRFEKNAVELNSLFFSPRLISSRLTMLNPAYYIKSDPFVRKQALKSLFAMATAGKIVEELGKAAGGTVETSDPTNSDYHKVRIGNTRIDSYGGHQQYITAASRLLAGAANSSLGNKDGMNLKTAASRTFGLGGRFPSTAENKLSPLVKFADDILFGRPATDNAKNGNVILNTLQIPHSAETARIANLFTPMILQDLQDLIKEDPSLFPLSFLSSQGMGVQTYEPEISNNGFRQLSR